MATTYSHRQTGWKFLALVFLLLVPFTTISMILAGEWVGAIVLAVVLVVVYGSLASLTTTVDRREVRAAFTLGWPQRTIPLKAIAEHETARNKWWYGWGVRKFSGGTLYSVWGLDSVEIRYQDPKKRKQRVLRIGTDDPDGLADAITAARAAAR